jgi:hypothetical protein
MRRRKRPTPAELGLTAAEGRILASLRTPQRMQEFLTALPANFEPDGDCLRSVRGVLRHREAHCLEAAFVAACALWLQGEPPLVMDLTSTREDADHVVTLFRRDGCWGAISKSNHVWLRWRDPVYRSLRELAMSYFHEYFNKGRKTLRTYSVSIDLRRFAPTPGSPARRIAGRSVPRSTMPRHYPLIRRRRSAGSCRPTPPCCGPTTSSSTKAATARRRANTEGSLP